MIKTYSDYSTTGGKTSDYYTLLEESPCAPNPSTGTIKADQTRIHFDLEVTKLSHKALKYKEFINQNTMQRRFASVMMAYHKRNGAYIYNQS